MPTGGRCIIDPMRSLVAALLLIGLAACSASGPTNETVATMGQDAGGNRAAFLRAVAGDHWANWPEDQLGISGDEGKPCILVTEESRNEAIRLLDRQTALQLDPSQAAQLTADRVTAGEGRPYLLRAFVTPHSVARAQESGNAVTVQSDGLGLLARGPRPRRHPCVALLARAPAQLFTVLINDQ
jgi:hypothetical protein